VSGSKVTFPGVAPWTNLVVSDTNTGPEVDLVLLSPQASIVQTFRLSSTGLAASKVRGILTFIDSVGKVVTQLAPGSLSDASGSTDPEEGVDYTSSIGTGNMVSLSVSADKGWVDAPGRAFPVTVDPTTVGQNGTPGDQNGDASDSTYVTENETGNNSASPDLAVGDLSGSYSTRSFIHFPAATSGASSVVGQQIVTFDNTPATLNMCVVAQNSAYPAVDAEQVVNPWTASGLQTWPGPLSGGPQNPLVESPSGTSCSSAGYNWVTWNVQPILIDWAAGAANNGIGLFEPSSEMYNPADFIEFASTNGSCGGGTCDVPYLNYTWTGDNATYTPATSFTEIPTATSSGLLQVTVKNTGTETWPGNSNLYLDYHTPSAGDLTTHQTVLPQSVAPGKSVTVNLAVDPEPPGYTYNLWLDMYWYSNGTAYYFSGEGVPEVEYSFIEPSQTFTTTWTDPVGTAEILDNAVGLDVEFTDGNSSTFDNGADEAAFFVCTASSMASGCINSGWLPAGSGWADWTTPALTWNQSYYWNVCYYDPAVGTTSQNPTPPSGSPGTDCTSLKPYTDYSDWAATFTPIVTAPPEAEIGSASFSPASQLVNPSSLNVTFTASDVSVANESLPLSISRTYNAAAIPSLMTKTVDAFGEDMTSILDYSVQASDILGFPYVQVVGPDGSDNGFAQNPSGGSWAEQSGGTDQLSGSPLSGWTEQTFSGDTYTFNSWGQITSEVIPGGASLTLSYSGSSGLKPIWVYKNTSGAEYYAISSAPTGYTPNTVTDAGVLSTDPTGGDTLYTCLTSTGVYFLALSSTCSSNGVYGAATSQGAAGGYTYGSAQAGAELLYECSATTPPVQFTSCPAGTSTIATLGYAYPGPPNATTITAGPSQRTLTLGWTTVAGYAVVHTVTTQAPTTGGQGYTWTYNYSSGGETAAWPTLTQVCSPVSSTACVTYTWSYDSNAGYDVVKQLKDRDGNTIDSIQYNDASIQLSNWSEGWSWVVPEAASVTDANGHTTEYQQVYQVTSYWNAPTQHSDISLGAANSWSGTAQWSGFDLPTTPPVGGPTQELTLCDNANNDYLTTASIGCTVLQWTALQQMSGPDYGYDYTQAEPNTTQMYLCRWEPTGLYASLDFYLSTQSGCGRSSATDLGSLGWFPEWNSGAAPDGADFATLTTEPPDPYASGTQFSDIDYFDAMGRISAHYDESNDETVYRYDQNGFLDELTDPDGDSETFVNDAGGHILQKTTYNYATPLEPGPQPSPSLRANTEYFTYASGYPIGDPRNGEVLSESKGLASSALDLTHSTVYTYNSNGSIASVTTPSSTAAAAPSAAGSSYVPITPEVGVYSVPAGQSTAVTIGNADGIPANASGVVASLMSVSSGTASVTAWPDGQTQPNAVALRQSSSGPTVSQVTIPIGADGKIDLATSSASSAIVGLGLLGYYVPVSLSTTQYQPVTPTAIVANQALSAGTTAIQVTGSGGVPAGASDAVVDLSVSGGSTSGYASVFADGTSGTTSVQMMVQVSTRSTEQATIPLSSAGKFDFEYGGTGSLTVVVVGYYSASPGNVFFGVPADDIVNTTSGSGLQGAGTTIAAGNSATYSTVGVAADGVPQGATAVTLSVSAEGSSAGSLEVSAGGASAAPAGPQLSYPSGVWTTGEVTVPVNSSGQITVWNPAGSSSLSVEVGVEGYFTASNWLHLAPTPTTACPTGCVTTYSYNSLGESVSSTASGNGSTYTPITPTRLNETLPASRQVNVTVTGTIASGITIPPNASAITAIISVKSSAGGDVHAWGAGQSSGAWQLDFQANWQVSDQATLPVGSQGEIALQLNGTASGSAYIDITGYYTPEPATGSTFVAVTPTRTISAKAITSASNSVIQVTGTAGVPAGATAAVVDLTTSSQSAASWLLAWPDGTTMPSTESQSWPVASQQTTSEATVTLSTSGAFDIHVGSGTATLNVDVLGYWEPSSVGQGSAFYPTVPAATMVMNSTATAGSIQGAGQTIASGKTATYNVVGPGLPTIPANASAVVATVAGYAASAGTMNFSAAGGAKPSTTQLSYPANSDWAANEVIIPISSTGQFTIYNNGPASANEFVAIDGFFAPGSSSAATVDTYYTTGDLDTVTYPTGTETDYIYDNLGRETSETIHTTEHPAGKTTNFSYDSIGDTLTETKATLTNLVTNVTNQEKITDGYDPDGQKLTETISDATGHDSTTRETIWTYDPAGDTQTETDPASRETHYLYDYQGHVQTRTDPMGNVTSYTYWPTGQLQSETLDNFVQNPQAWTGSGTPPACATNPPYGSACTRNVTVVSDSYDPAGRLATSVDGAGYETDYTYFPDNSQATVTLKNDNTATGSRYSTIEHSYTYNPAGEIVSDSQDNGLRNIWNYYDSAGTLLSTVTDPGGQAETATYSYDPYGNVNVTETSNVNGPVSATEGNYNNEGEELSFVELVANPLTGSVAGITSSYGYDNTGRVTSVTNPNLQTTTTNYDADGNVSSITEPTAQLTSQSGGSTSSVSPETLYGYDTFGDLANTEQVQDGAVVTYGYNGDGQVTSKSGPSYWEPVSSALNSSPTEVTPLTSYIYNADGQVTSATDADGNTTTYTVDTLGRIAQTASPSDPSSPSVDTQYFYNDDGVQTGSEDGLGNLTEITPNASGQPVVTTTIDNTSGAQMTTNASDVYDAAGDLTSATDADGNTSTYTYDGLGELASSTEPPASSGDNTNRTTTYTYNGNGQLLAVTDPLGRQTTNVYDSVGRLLSTQPFYNGSAVTPAATFSYDSDGNQTQMVDPNGWTTTTGYNALDEPTSTTQQITASTSITTTTAYDAAGSPTDYTDGNGNTTTVMYDSREMPWQVDEPPMSNFEFGNPVDVDATRTVDGISCSTAQAACLAVDAGGFATTESYGQWTTPTQVDPSGSLNAVSCVAGSSSCYAVDSSGHEYTYNGSWSAPQDVDGSRNLTTVSCPTASFCAAADSSGYVTIFNGSIWSTPTDVDSTNGITAVSCTSSTFCVASDGDGGALVYNGSAWSRTTVNGTTSINSVACASSTYCVAISSGSIFTYNGTTWTAATTIDPSHTLTSIACPSSSFCLTTDNNGSVFTFNGSAWSAATNSDPTHNITTATCPSSSVCYFADTSGNVDFLSPYRNYYSVYDPDGRLITTVDPNWNITTDSYNPRGDLTNQAVTGSGSTITKAVGFSADDQATSFNTPSGTQTITYNMRDEPIASSGPEGSFSATYDPNGNPLSTNDGTGTNIYTWNGDGLLKSAAIGLSGLTYGYTYNADDDRTLSTNSDGAQEAWSYDGLGRLASINLAASSSSTPFMSVAYGYDNDSNVNSFSSSATVGSTNASSGSQTYTYDGADRMVSWTNGTSTTNYTYDKDGNRTGAGSTTYGYNQDDQLTTSVSGSVSTPYSYNLAGDLTQVGASGAGPVYTYDNLNRQSSTTSGSTTTTYAYDALDRLQAINTANLAYDATSAEPSAVGTTLIARLADGTPVAQRNGSTVTLPVIDQHGDIVGQAAANGETASSYLTYDPWGTVLSTTGTNTDVLGYQGQLTLPDGSTHMGARNYSPTLGTFESQDTYSASNPAMPSYVYGADNPMSATDTNGHTCAVDSFVSAAECFGANEASNESRTAALDEDPLVDIEDTAISIGDVFVGIFHKATTWKPAPISNPGDTSAWAGETVIGANGSRTSCSGGSACTAPDSAAGVNNLIQEIESGIVAVENTATVLAELFHWIESHSGGVDGEPGAGPVGGPGASAGGGGGAGGGIRFTVISKPVPPTAPQNDPKSTNVGPEGATNYGSSQPRVNKYVIGNVYTTTGAHKVPATFSGVSLLPSLIDAFTGYNGSGNQGGGASQPGQPENPLGSTGGASVDPSEMPPSLDTSGAGARSGGGPTCPASRTLLYGSEGSVGRIPQDVKDALAGKEFSSFDALRSAVWQAIANNPSLAAGWSPSNLTLMQNGNAPFASESQTSNGSRGGLVYNLHHITPVHQGGSLLDLNNLVIASPLYHASVLDPGYHYGKGC
jgi:RHS repeat-associated protein